MTLSAFYYSGKYELDTCGRFKGSFIKIVAMGDYNSTTLKIYIDEFYTFYAFSFFNKLFSSGFISDFMVIFNLWYKDYPMLFK